MSTADHLPEATPPAEHKAPPGKGPTPGLPNMWRLVFAGLLALILVAVALVGLGLYADQKSGDAERADQTLSEFAQSVAAVCTKSPVEARKLGIECGKAKEIDERPAGAKGDPGAKGDQGDRGPKGDTGATGARGPTGATGPTPPCLLQANRCVGASGVPGATGARGPIGLTGPTGATGATGAAGSPGKAGQDGAPGAKGDTGAKGDDGAKGDKGDTGGQGEKGDQGIPGLACEPGSTLQKQRVLTTEAPIAGIWVLVCVLDDQNP